MTAPRQAFAASWAGVRGGGAAAPALGGAPGTDCGHGVHIEEGDDSAKAGFRSVVAEAKERAVPIFRLFAALFTLTAAAPAAAYWEYTHRLTASIAWAEV